MPLSFDDFPAPYDRFKGEVWPEWVDRNGHMNLAYYTVLCKRSVRAPCSSSRKAIS